MARTDFHRKTLRPSANGYVLYFLKKGDMGAMATGKKEINLLELFEKHAATKTEAKRVYGLVEKYDLMALDMNNLLAIKGMGRKAALLVMEVACDLKGKK